MIAPSADGLHHCQPENILVEVTPSATPGEEPTLLLKLLDFGLATHFSASQPKLTTCCGSPAYHSPELWRGLREPSGTVKYWVSPDLSLRPWTPQLIIFLIGARGRYLVLGTHGPSLPDTAQVSSRHRPFFAPSLVRQSCGCASGRRGRGIAAYASRLLAYE